MKITITLFTFLLSSIVLMAQSDIWSDINTATSNLDLKERLHAPDNYRTLSFDASNFLSRIGNAPSRTADPVTQRTGTTIQFPMPDGAFQSFYLVDAELMHPDLAAEFPELKSYIGKGIDDPTADIRITYSPHLGFHGMIKSGEHSTVYIDPLTTDNENYMVYYRANLETSSLKFNCLTPEPERLDSGNTGTEKLALGDCNLRRYRLALSCNGEYAQYHIGQAGGTTGTTAGDKAIVQAAMNVTMARVNGVYEIDLGITLQIIPNNADVIYLDPSSDPWNGEYSTTTAQTLDAIIGVNNYDIGHNFNTSGGGSAGCIDCVCEAISQGGTHKGRGYTGLSAPVGDPFDIDYVAHEMGHQFGGYHTQSNQSCRSGNNTEVEPGSASTIMGYAGICSANVQNNSDDYFAYVNIRDIVTSINSGDGSTCAEVIVSGNSGPTASAGANYAIPISTPFKLEGTGMDADDTGLTYCWEQNDPENPGSNSTPPTTRTVGPMFRSLDPVSVPYRYMPNLTSIVNNTNPTWEVLPSVGRAMEFSFTVRDNNMNSGCTDTGLMSVTTVAAAGPFLVTSPNMGGILWSSGDTETITWNVAGTTASPVSCANVDILMSTDGGFTYPTTLASSVPNDGSQSIVVPNITSTTVRIMVVCSDNIFFDISNQDLEIEFSAPDFNISANPTSVTACQPNDANYMIDITSIGGFAGNVTLSASGIPAGSTASFSTNPIIGGTGTTTLTLTTAGVALGTYPITIQAVGSTGTKTTMVNFTVATFNTTISLLSPANGATNINANAPLSWNASAGANSYEVEVATDAAFSNIVDTQSGLITTSTTAILSSNSTYYWRVRVINDCGMGAWSAIWNFMTEDICSPISIKLDCGTPYNGTMRTATADFNPYNGTSTSYPGADELFRYTHVGGPITITLSGVSPIDLDMIIMDDCNPTSANLIAELQNNNTASGEIYTNANLAAGTYYIYIDSRKNKGLSTYTLEVTPCPITLSPKVFLQGPFSGSSMVSGVGSGGMIPTTSPYADAKTATTGVLSGMVDWVYVEIRDAATGATVLEGQSALLKPDGTVVDTDGISPLSLGQAAGNYHVAIRHRNHLGVMTATPITVN